MFVMKLKALLNEPFIQAQYFMEVWQVFPNELYFINTYQSEVEKFLNDCIFEDLVYPVPI
jgi:hypothetical protein